MIGSSFVTVLNQKALLVPAHSTPKFFGRYCFRIWMGLIVLAACFCPRAYPEEGTLVGRILTVPHLSLPLPVSIPLAKDGTLPPGALMELEEIGASAQASGEHDANPAAEQASPASQVVGQVCQAPDPEGLPTQWGTRFLALIPNGAGLSGEPSRSEPVGEAGVNGGNLSRRFRVAQIFEPDRRLENPTGTLGAGDDGKGGFQFLLDQFQLVVRESEKPVLAYNYAPVTAAWVPERDRRRTRACYIHPVFGLDGEILSDDFPADHYHHHGIFWTWPHILIDNQEYDLWADRGIRQRFHRWLQLSAGPVAAVFAVENGWYVGDKLVLLERMWVTVWRSTDFGRVINFELFLQPVENPVTLWGAEGKSYGGFTFRFHVKPGQTVKITVPEGLTTEDLLETRLRWADLSSQFAQEGGESGATIVIPPDHPDFPPTWLTRHYGVLCVGWPGTQPRTLSPEETVRLPYQVWIHRDAPSAEAIESVVQALHQARLAAWEECPRSAEP